MRTRSDDDLAALLRARPDLLSPVPNDLTQLATRAGTRASVVRAVERLDRFALQTAEALAVAPDPCPYETLRALMTGDPPGPEPATAADPEQEPPEPVPEPALAPPLRDRVAAALPAALATLRAQALVWGGDDRLRLVRTARELLAPSPTAPSPTGLGPTVREATAGMSPGRLQELLGAVGLPPTHDPVSAVTALTGLFTDRARAAALLAQAPPAALAALAKLTWGPPYGEVTVASPGPPVAWLLARGLLLPLGPRTVVLPREVALHLRGGRAHRAPEPVPPPLSAAAAEHGPQAVDAAAAGQALAALATVEELLTLWGAGGPAVLRAGGLSIRDLKRTAVALDLAEPVAAFWIELAYAAGLLASDGEADERYAPTPAYDDWLALPTAPRWAALATAWLAATRTPGLVGGRDAKGRALAALGPDLDRSAAPEVRRRVLSLLAAAPPGAALAAEALLARLRWDRPAHRGQTPAEDPRSRLAEWTLAEAELLGVTGRGALSSYARTLLPPPETPATATATPTPRTATPRTTTSRTTPAESAAAAARAADLLAPLLPKPLDHVLLQADLTAVAPGPLERPLAETMSVLADVESKGGATVYRFTPASVRRALDAGRGAADLHAFLAAHSRTPVPQPLTYLIDDVARKHGRLRVGAASAYLRCDDDALLTEILADRRSAALGLRRLAPTVLASPAPPDTLLETLRAMGYAPAAESAAGDVLVTRAPSHRTPPRAAPVPVPEGPPVPGDTLLAAALRAIRAGDLAATAPHRPPAPATGPTPGVPHTTSADTLATVQAAALTGSPVWIGYVNADGAASQRVIAPVRVEGGFVTAYDHTADEIRTYPLHRITGAAELTDPADDTA
ncbi:helicase C-terminal domain-containing protein [Streptomyces sp. B1866]|uniref:helicase C-terminal domain-containing protein n=1 Tax=Streptomyces sp. B1866 TaxID=3075431 RepID=UPI0028924D38|nr:helicase C-terminal domain-containing protein [Streptomyces sp. B1866]MDT3395922.1 helicase C-terminal domain-containing protein [Streptomyces sp. B1866]